MKKIAKAIAVAAMAVVVGAGSATAAEGPNVGSVGVGPQYVDFDWWVPGFSVRVWATNEFGVEGNVFYGTSEDEWFGDASEEETLLATLKLMYAPIVMDNSRFYVGLEGGLGHYSYEVNGVEMDDEDYYLVKPLIGTEFNFSEFEEVGFNFEVGYAFTGYEDDFEDDKEDESYVSLGLGAHYYF